MVFAASLGLAAEVATRLALLLGTLLLLLIVVLWLTRRAFRLWHRYAYRVLRDSLAWAARHPRLGRLPAALLDPAHPEARGLSLLGLLLLLAGATLLWTLQAVGGTALPDLDETVRHGLAALHTPWADRLLLPLAALGAPVTLLPLVIAVLLWLMLCRHWQAAGHWLAAALFAGLFALLQGLPAASAALHHSVVLAASIYGFLTVLLARETGERWRWLTYAGAALLLVAIGFARLYLQTQLLSEVAIGLSLGLLWATLLGIAWLRHPAGRPAARPLLAVALMSILAAGLWYRTNEFPAELTRHAAATVAHDLDTGYWQQQGWAALPAERDDVRHHRSHPLTLQYAGPLAALRQALEGQGWGAPAPLDALSWLHWLNLDVAVSELPVLPQVHAGQHQQLLLVKPEADGRQLRTLRLWFSGAQLQPGAHPLWIGNATWLEATQVLGAFSVPRTVDDFITPLDLLRQDLTAAGWRLSLRQRGDGGQVLLLVKP
jgi:undecaprenyl-diphosphatase